MSAKNVDKITEAYRGNLGTVLMESSRNRIHWVCSHAKGENILDVGCSQGIASIILAREGKQVKGIDICYESIEYANLGLESEDSATQNRVEFICCDFTTLARKHPKNRYDCILMGEVLEHLADPLRFVQYAFSLLTDKGVLIVTVPFGINDYHDHKRTYYLTELYATLAAFFTVEHIEFLGSWVGVVCTKAKTAGIELDSTLFARTELAFYAHERSLLNKIAELQKDNQIKNTQISQWKIKAEEHLASASDLTNARDMWKTKAEEHLASISDLTSARDIWRTKAEEHLASVSDLTSAHEISLRNERESFISQLTAINSGHLETQNTMAQALIEKDTTIIRHQKIYDDLANSKFGRIQVWMWERRERKRLRQKNKLPLKERLRQHLKRSRLLVYIVRKLRNQPTKSLKIKKTTDLPSNIILKNKTEPTPLFDMQFMTEIEKLITGMPISNSGRYYRRSNQRVAIISDEFLYNTFKDIANTVALHPSNWYTQIVGIDMLFVISGWRGIKEEWRGFSRTGSDKRNIILEIIKHCKNANIPTVFYSIEDPPNYKQFLEIAQHCDHVFTTADEVVSDYKRDCGHERVYTLMFGINPLFHNPVGSMYAPKRNEVIFSGSWLDKYPDRGKDICSIFDGVVSSKYGLKVLDRNFSLNDPQYAFPAKYAQYISPGVQHEVLQKVHKLYDWAINMNSVKDSQTMFANRVFELEATGNLMLSNYSVGVNSHLPLIYTVVDGQEAVQILNNLTATEIEERQAAGIRHAMTGNTCFDRYSQLCQRLGIETVSQWRTIAVVVNKLTKHIIEQFERQSYLHRELITTSELLENYDKYDTIAFFNESNYYDIFYLEDMVNAFKYTDSDYITNHTSKKHDFTQDMPSKYLSVFWRESFTAEQLIKMPDGYISLLNGYAIDGLHCNPARIKGSVKKQQNYKLSVIVPVYNNGLHLYGKAFSSLRRSSMFEDMEIIFVDDGSTDDMTSHYVRYIADRYVNVVTFSFGDGGSGSASRPRNKGVEMATSDYITFLDPDNEAINDAYATLYRLAIDEGHDLVVGNMLRCREQTALANYYHYFKGVYGNDVVTSDKREFLSQISFTPMSIQAMVIKKQIVEDSGIIQVPGAVGQDSLFSWQLMYVAKSIKAIETPAHIYYALRSDSTVNTLGAKFFYKNLLLEQVQVKWLEEEGLLDSYMDIRFNNFFRDWILQKLSICRSDEKKDCVKYALEIFELYRNFYDGKDSNINDWLAKQET